MPDTRHVVDTQVRDCRSRRRHHRRFTRLSAWRAFITMSKKAALSAIDGHRSGKTPSIASSSTAVPLESLVKFAYQRVFRTSGFTKNPDFAMHSITVNVFRWLACPVHQRFQKRLRRSRAKPDLRSKKLPTSRNGTQSAGSPISRARRQGRMRLITGHPPSVEPVGRLPQETELVTALALHHTESQ